MVKSVSVLTFLLFIVCGFARAQDTTLKAPYSYFQPLSPSFVPAKDSLGLITTGVVTTYQNSAFIKAYKASIFREGFNQNAPLNQYDFYDTSSFNILVGPFDINHASDYSFRFTTSLQRKEPWRKVIVRINNINSQILAGILNSFNPGTYFSGMNELGKFSLNKNEFIIAELLRNSDSTIVTSTLFRWRKIEPQLFDVTTFNDFSKIFKKTDGQTFVVKDASTEKMDSARQAYWKQRYTADQLDSVTHLPKKLILHPKENSVVFQLDADINDRHQVEYELIKDGSIYSNWKPNDVDNEYIWLSNLPAGDYLLKVRYPIQAENVLTYPFLVEEAWYETIWFKIIAIILMLGFLGCIVLLIRARRQKAALEAIKKAQLTTSLQSLQSQLNPHFVYNALSSIQGLVNTNRIGAASEYLSEFGNLLRASLESNEREFVSLDAEIKVVDTYLHLEQLRFGFQYSIAADATIRNADIDFPPLLLQPVVENSVKHGVATLGEKGKIEVRFSASGSSLLVTISDNGIGYNTQATTGGYGLQLTQKRLQLISQLVSGRTVTMSVTSAKHLGTVTTFVFKNWLL